MDYRIVEIDPTYIDYLYAFDDKVPVEHPGHNSRKYLGILFDIDNRQFYAPMSSPKPKHLTINPHAPDVYKIDDGNLGIINLNNMIPVPEEAIIFFDISGVQNEKYRILLTDQARIFHRDETRIKKKAERLYDMRYRDNTKESVKDRCCDFRLLEEKCVLYTARANVAATTSEAILKIDQYIKNHQSNDWWFFMYWSF